MFVKDIAIINPKSDINNFNFINYIDTSSVFDGKLLNIQVLKDNYPSRAQRELQERDILISSVRPNLMHNYFVKSIISGLVASSGFIHLRVIDNKIIPQYLYYFLTTENNIESYISIASSSQTTFPAFSKEVIENLEIPNISIEKQQHIVDTIGSVDSLIEINNGIIAKIEDHISHQFALIYNQNEEYDILEDHCQVVLGGTPSRANTEYWNGDIPWINSGEVNKDSIYFGTEYITKLGLQKSATKLMPKNTVVLAITGATLGQVSILKIDACANQSVIGILESSSLPYEFLLPLAKYKIRYLMSNQTGGAQQHINKNDVSSMIFNKPCKEEMDLYLTKTKDIFLLEEKIQIKNNYLQTIRQALLSKYF